MREWALFVVALVILACERERPDVDPAEALRLAAAYYGTEDRFTLNYEVEYVFDGASVSGHGRLDVDRPGRFRLEEWFPGGNRLLAISDGERVLVDFRADRRAYAYESSRLWAPLLGLHVGTRDASDYLAGPATCPGDPVEGVVCIRLTARPPDPGYIDHVLGVSVAGDTRGRILWMVLYDRSMTAETITFREREPGDRLVDGTAFALVPPPGAVDISAYCNADGLPAATCPRPEAVDAILERILN